MTYRPSAARSVRHDGEPNVFPFGPTRHSRWVFHRMANNYWKFRNFVSDLIRRYRRALAGNKKDSTIESFPLFFRVRTTQPQLIEKPRLFALFPSFSLSFCSRAAWGQGRMAFPDRLTSTRPALHTSAFTVAFFGDYACGVLRALWWLCTSEGVKSSWMSSTVVFYTDWQQTLKEWNIQ